MGMIKCTECSKDISDQAKTCPGCGAPNKARTSKAKPFVIGGIVAVAIVFAANLADAQKPEARQRSKERAAIDLCNKEAEDPILTFGEKRFILTACRKMESDFREKWRRNP